VDQLRRDEYKALRATIMNRGTVRVITFLVTMIAWAALTLFFAVSGPRNIVGTLVTLMVLAAGFEVVYQLHLGVERVGRYLQIAFEEADVAAAERGQTQPLAGPRWETTAMAYGRTFPAAGSDALFSAMFVLATVVNMLPVLEAWRVPGAFVSMMVPHVAFLVRVRIARHVVGVQRAQDLERFRALAGTTDARPKAEDQAPDSAEGSRPVVAHGSEPDTVQGP
jgi:hypothetical protein